MLKTASADASRLKPWALSLAVAALWLAGCIVEDGDKACGKNQIKVDGEGALFCQCAPGYIIDTTTGLECKPCGDNEEVVQGECVCKEGYTRSSPSASCNASALGSACSDDSGCTGDTPICADSYCTSECTSSLDCSRGWVCEKHAPGNVCMKAPEGYGKTCASSAECSGTGATYCETFQAKSCLVECSKSSPCPGDWSCCNITVLGVMICVEPAALTGGNCPGGGELVTP